MSPAPVLLEFIDGRRHEDTLCQCMLVGLCKGHTFNIDIVGVFSQEPAPPPRPLSGGANRGAQPVPCPSQGEAPLQLGRHRLVGRGLANVEEWQHAVGLRGCTPGDSAVPS